MKDQQESENRILRRQLKAFVAQARENEAKLERFNAQELALISATSIPELVHLTLHHYPESFRLDSISLILLDPEYELTRMLEHAGVALETLPGLMVETDHSALLTCFGDSPLPQLGPFVADSHQHLFPPRSRSLRSCALLPLMRRGELIGSLNLGSASPERFITGSGTAFLERLGAIVAVCIENCANRQRLELLGITDPLTRVNNRRYFDQRLSEEMAAAQRNAYPLSCMFLDIDHFKQINDTFGHQSGDHVLQEVAMLINCQLRQSDLLCRYGGEEFVVLLPETDDKHARDIAERIRRSIAENSFRLSDSKTVEIRISIGVSTYAPHSGEVADLSGSTLLASADQALYNAKATGRDRICSKPQSVAETADS